MLLNHQRVQQTNPSYIGLSLIKKKLGLKDYFMVTSNFYGMLDGIKVDSNKIWEMNGNISYF